jgi:hypothetical protein
MNKSCPLLDMQCARISKAIEKNARPYFKIVDYMYDEYSSSYMNIEDESSVDEYNEDLVADVIYAHGWYPYQYHRYAYGKVNLPSRFGF